MAELPGWLLVPGRLGLDAALVAMLWQRAAAAWSAVPVATETTLGLGLVVWGIYAVDRVADAARGATATDRHAFAARHRRGLLGLAGGCWLAALLLIPTLPFSLLLAGCGVALCVLGYLWVVHLAAGRMRWLARGKEVLVGACFGIGTMLPIVLTSAAIGLGMAVAFGTICWCNCVLIEAWEGRAPFGARDVAVMLTVFVASAACLPLGAVAAFASLFVLLGGFAWFGPARPALARATVDLAMAALGAAWWLAA